MMGLDCFTLLNDLDRAGISNAKVADLLGHSESTVNRWKQGAEPKWSDGQLLLALHGIYCKNIPKTESGSS